jgi:hypothetical protein
MITYRSVMYRLVDSLLFVPVYAAALVLKAFRRIGSRRLPQCKKALLNVGVFPIIDHYYEPQFDLRNPGKAYSQNRGLPGIDWNITGQLDLLRDLSFTPELAQLESTRIEGVPPFSYQNTLFSYGDADYWYQLIRKFKPRRIFEIGSGNSTIVARLAIKKNCEECPDYVCKHVCIEPFENPWLAGAGVTLMRDVVEHVGVDFFAELEENDILFIDSSHIIRPQGDVLFEYLELLPSLKKGVIVHVHDIFSPKNYPEHWLAGDVKFWNEQYLLEAFLANNSAWEIIGALNYLYHQHHEELKPVAPILLPAREPGSFYMRKVT